MPGQVLNGSFSHVVLEAPDQGIGQRNAGNRHHDCRKQHEVSALMPEEVTHGELKKQPQHGWHRGSEPKDAGNPEADSVPDGRRAAWGNITLPSARQPCSAAEYAGTEETRRSGFRRA